CGVLVGVGVADMSESPDSRIQVLLFFLLQIDDKEFDIPQVDTPPTLESILNEPEDEDEAFVLEDTCLLGAENIDAHSCETLSLGSSDSGDRSHHKRRRPLEPAAAAAVHGSVLRHNVLKGISAQMASAAVSLVPELRLRGRALRACALPPDTNQALRLCLGSVAEGVEYGAVSALSINHDCTRLLCGFAKGQITMWDLANGKLLRTITDAHPPGTAILHVKFTDDPTLAVCNDSGGSVFELTFRRVMGLRSCDSRCLFSGSKGEVCCVEPLHASTQLRDHPITQHALLAMASLTKILVIGLKPSLKVWMTFPYGKVRTGEPSVPQLAWQFVVAHKMVNPMLAFCRGDTVHFLLVKKDESGVIHVIKQRQLHLNCDLISLTWINSRTLLLLDSSERLHVLDRPSQEELETVDLSEVQLVYNSSHFKSLATGGNVSQALALVGEKACYQSVCCYSGQVVFLGTKSVHMMTLRNWRERVEHLLKQEKFVEALSLAWSFHEGTAKAVVGLYGDPAKRKSVVADKMVEILLLYADRSLKKCPEQGRIQVMEQHFQDMVPIMVDYCLLLHRTDLLFGQIYSRLVENSVAKGVFLESLEPYILSERIGCLTAPIMRDLLSHFQENGMMDSVENCLVHMDITSLDIQQVVQMCWEHQLYDAMIYVFNSGMNDYISPMEVSSKPALLDTFCSVADEQVVMGNKLLVYISCSLAGRAYPLGDIPEDLVPLVKNQVFEFLIRLHTPEAPEEEEVYPYIHTLLHFDTREFLNVLALTFEDFKNDKQALEYQQRIVDILLKVMVETSDFTPSQVGCLFTFLARQLAKPDNTLFVNRKLFDQVLEFLCSPDDDSRHTERQQVLLELLQVGGVIQFDEGRLLSLAEKAEFYQICEFVYEKKHLYDKIFFCYLKDPMRREEIFNYVHNMLSMPGYRPQERHSVREKALEHIQVTHLGISDTHITHWHITRVLVILFVPPSLLATRPQVSLRLGPGVHECHVDLLCRFSPQKVIDFLKASKDYRLEEAVQVCRQHALHAATAYLLERKGDVLGAFQVLLQVRGIKPPTCRTEKPLTELLGEFLSLSCSPPDVAGPAGSLKELTMQVLNSMSSFISLPAIVQRILQDPVYGKGKLAEIQGLILGMLETFTYEQTLLETTTNLLNQDLHWSLSHLRSAVSRALHPRFDHCNICLQQYKRRQEGADEIVVFSCGHLYHCQCLQSKCCTQLEWTLAWSCYKCTSSQGRRDPFCVLSQLHPDAELDAQQRQSWDQLRCMYRGPSRLTILAELSRSHGNEKAGQLHPAPARSTSIFHSENFQLRLSPPPLVEE
uniref:VPS8 subunit of CORVET complex n=1 Tax=Scleropages formosus TaxID=113540 RepID=A0A8C9T9N3_SCLFO